jgi:hypothetical protein
MSSRLTHCWTTPPASSRAVRAGLGLPELAPQQAGHDTVAEGDVGEIVVTTLDPHHPWIRLAIGYLTAALLGKSPCGRTTCASRARWAAPTKRQK